MEEAIMRSAFIGSILAVGLATAPILTINPASAAEVVGVHVGGVGLGFKVGNGHYYDRNHRRRSYTYPSDYKTYHHNQSWYRSHRNWNDENHADWYRR